MKQLFLLILLFFAALHAEEIIVPLSASTTLCKTFLNCEGIDEKLGQILTYDLAHNGYCLLVPQKKDASLVIKAIQTQKGLTLQATQKGRTLSSPPLTLHNQLNLDRKVIHQAHDALCLELFGQKGIASNRILFAAKSQTKNADIWISDYDGANSRQLTHENTLIVTPTLLPGKQKEENPYFLYVSYKEGEPKIFLGGAKGAKRLTYMLGNQFMPTLSRQLDRIAFISTIHGKEDLFIQDFSVDKGVFGKAKKLFSAPMATQGTPSFSPSGKEITFVSNKDGTPRIYVMRIPNPNETRTECPLRLISKKNRENTSPNWSPDGQKIAYSSLTRGVRQIWIYDMKQEKEIQLTFGTEHSENPIWAADSLHLLYNSASYEKCELYMIDCNQMRPAKISAGPKDKRFPAWEG